MKKLDRLVELARSKGLDILSFGFVDLYHMQVVYHELSKAGRIPVMANCRDKKDYELLMEAWIKRGTIYSPEYPDFDALLTGELKRLKNA